VLTASFDDRQEEDALPRRPGLRRFGGQPFHGDFRPHKDDPLPLAEVIPAEVGWRAAGDNDSLHLVAAGGEFLPVAKHLADCGAQLAFLGLAAGRFDFGNPDGLPAHPGQVIPWFLSPGRARRPSLGYNDPGNFVLRLVVLYPPCSGSIGVPRFGGWEPFIWGRFAGLLVCASYLAGSMNPVIVHDDAGVGVAPDVWCPPELAGVLAEERRVRGERLEVAAADRQRPAQRLRSPPALGSVAPAWLRIRRIGSMSSTW
jgi:hypothetical protein